MPRHILNKKKYDEAEVLYEDVLKDSQTPNAIKKNIELTLQSLNQKTQKHFVKTTLGIGYGYDSNTDNISNEDLIYLGGLPFKLNNKQVSDHFSEYIMSLRHSYKVSDNLAIESKLGGYAQKYRKEDDNDIAVASLGTGLAYSNQNYKVSLGIEYNYISLDNRDYIRSYGVVPAFDYQINENLLYKAKLKIMKKDFRQEIYNFRDSMQYELQNSLVLSTAKFGINTFSIAAGTDDKIKDKAWNVDHDYASVKYENLYPITQSTLVSTVLELYADRYNVKEEVLYKNNKKDTRINADFGVIQSLNKNLSIGVHFRYTDNNSNQSLYEYDKYTAKANIYYAF